MELLQCVFIVFLSHVSGVVNQFTKPNGDLDLAALTSHMLKLEQTVSDLQSQNRVQEQKQAAVLSSVLSKLTSTTEELSGLRIDLVTLEMKHNATVLKLASVETELESLKKDKYSTDREFVKFQSQITLINGEQKTMATEITDMKKGNNSNLRNSMARQLKQIDEKLTRVSTELENLDNKQNSTMIDLLNVTSKIEQIETDLHPMSTGLTKMNQTLESSIIPTQANLKMTLEHMEKQVQTVKNISDRHSDQKVLFKADLSEARTFLNNSIIVFDHVEINLGGAYNSSSGVFRAPVSGIYFFAASVQSLDLGISKSYIVKDGTRETPLVTLTTYDLASSATVVYVHKGDNVYVLMSRNSGDRLQKHIATHFSGCLVRADYMKL